MGESLKVVTSLFLVSNGRLSPFLFPSKILSSFSWLHRYGQNTQCGDVMPTPSSVCAHDFSDPAGMMTPETQDDKVAEGRIRDSFSCAGCGCPNDSYRL